MCPLYTMPKGKPEFCECGCGVTPTNYRKKFKEAFPNGYPFINGGLYYCGNSTCKKGLNIAGMKWNSKVHIDHIKPKDIGGTNCINNLHILCESCNTSKKNNISRGDIGLTNNGKASMNTVRLKHKNNAICDKYNIKSNTNCCVSDNLSFHDISVDSGIELSFNSNLPELNLDDVACMMEKLRCF